MDNFNRSRLEINDQQLLVIFNQVRPDKREDFVRFVNDVLCPAAASLRPVSICHTQLLEPHVANEDGNFTYVVLLDPAFRDVDEPVCTILTEAYGEDASQPHLDAYRACQVNSDEGFVLADKDEQAV